MDAEIHAVDKGKRESEGNALYVRGTRIECMVGRFDGLPFGDDRDQQYIEVRANSWEGDTNSRFTARLNAEDLERLFEAALGAGVIKARVSQRALQLVEQLREELAITSRRP